MKGIIFALVVGVVGLCQSFAIAEDGDKTPTVIAPCVALSGADSHVLEPGYFRVTSLKDWTQIWQKHKGLKQDVEYDFFYDTAGLPVVDFDRFMVIAIFQGRVWNTAGIKSVSIVEEKERIVFRFENKSYQTGPAGDLRVPYGFFVIPRSSKPVVLQEDVKGVIGDPPVWKERITFPKL